MANGAESFGLTAGESRYMQYMAASGTASLAEVRKGLDMHPRAISRLSFSLKEKGLLEIARDGLYKRVSVAESKHAQIFRKMVLEHRHVPFHRLLSGSGFKVLSAVCSTRLLGSRKAISRASSISEASVARSLERLKQAGILQKKGGLYVVSLRFQDVKEFVLEFRRYLNQKTAQSFARNSIIVWERNDEFIVETSLSSSTRKENEEDEEQKKQQKGKGFFRLTGPSSFGRFGIKLMMPVSYYYFCPSRSCSRPLRLEDLLVHSLLIPQSERSTLATLLVWKKNEKSIRMSYLLERAREYDVDGRVRIMIRYLESGGKETTTAPPGMPTWDEFKSKAEEYGIKP